MNNQAKRVLARYYADPQDSLNPTRDNVPFLEYLKQKSELPFNIGDTPGDSVPGVTYNPYYNPDPSSCPKDIGDSEVFVKNEPTHPLFNRPKVFEDDKSLDFWRRSRRRDWTKNPSQQQPAISIDRRHASVKRVLERYLSQGIPVESFEKKSDDSLLRFKEGASLNQVLNKDFHYKNDKKIERASRVSVRWDNQANEKETKSGKFIWKTQSSSSNKTHTTIFQFTQHENKGESKTNIRYIDLPMKFSCSCESFLWYGAQWYAIQGGYMYLPALRVSVMPPRSHTQISRVRVGKGLNFRACKHILAVYNEIQSWTLKTEYKELIKVSPLSKIQNPEVFERFLGIPFTYQDIKEALQKRSPMTPKMRNFFRYKVQGTKLQKKALSKLDRWYFTKFRKMNDSQKIKALEAFVNHPEEIFYLMLRDAVVKNGKISDNFIKEGIILMSKIIDPEYGAEIKKGNLDSKPENNQFKQEGLSEVPNEQKISKVGMGIVDPEELEEFLYSIQDGD